MVTEISNGRQSVKLNRGKAMYQLAYYAGGRRVQKNFADRAACGFQQRESRLYDPAIAGRFNRDIEQTILGCITSKECEFRWSQSKTLKAELARPAVRPGRHPAPGSTRTERWRAARRMHPEF